MTHTRWEPGGHVNEITVDFPVERLDDVAEILNARTRRVISDQERERLAAIAFGKHRSQCAQRA